ncbi:MAG: short-subunit dehydrogenase [Gammaproteobacteria bacterium]|jgi:short-subunit dehydrogenase
MYFRNKQVVVTGGAGGIGSLLCKQLKAQGAMVTVIDRVTSLDFETDLIEGDLSSLEGVAKIVDQLQHHTVDILINLAGLQYFGVFEEQSPEQTALLYNVNLLAPILLTQALIPGMKQRGNGHIVNIGSTFGSINFAYFVTYSSSKAGLQGFSEALRRELNGDGIDVTYIAPRAAKTPLNSKKVLEFAEITKMNMDPPEWVVDEIILALKNEKKDVYLGFPENMFVRINALFPRLVDFALAGNTRKAKPLFQTQDS